MVTPMQAGRSLLLLCLVALGATAVVAQSPEEIFARGNAAYEQGRYEDAAEAYRDVLRYAVQDPIVEYNLGNAEFRLGNLGRAIVHYERARRLDPTDVEIQGNLAFARSFCFDQVEVPEQSAVLGAIQGLQNRVGPDRQAWAILVVVWAIAAIVAWCFARPGGWRAIHGWGISALVLVLVAVGASWWVTFDRLEGTELAVVQEDAVEVLAGPGYSNPALFTVHEGLTVEVRLERDEWLQVSLPNGLNGWIARRAVEPV
jgi:tetratricopeptide (TPR) repeat protein